MNEEIPPEEKRKSYGIKGGHITMIGGKKPSRELISVLEKIIDHFKKESNLKKEE